MNTKLKLKINSSMSILALMSFMIIEGNYWAILPKFFLPAFFRYLIWIAILILTVIVAHGKIVKSRYLLPWLAYLIMIIIRNQEFIHGEYLNSERIILCVLAVFVCASQVDWICKIPGLIIGVGILNALATIVFFLNNSLYEKFISLTYRTYQNGTLNGQYGYRAALADHYSQNGTYISIVLIVLIAYFFTLKKGDNRRRLPIVVLCCISIIALLLTGKRAHLLFTVATSIILYYVANPKQRVGKTFKLMAVCGVLCFVISLLIEYVPQLAYTFDRLQNVGTDSASMNRIIMWQYATKMINNAPIFGVGWWGFRYEAGIINILDDAVTGCHNIYLEITANCGFVGLIILMVSVLSSLIASLKNIGYCLGDELLDDYTVPILASTAIQIFCLMYGFTGNVIFDRTFHFYMVAICVNLAFTIHRNMFLTGGKSDNV